MASSESAHSFSPPSAPPGSSQSTPGIGGRNEHTRRWLPEPQMNFRWIAPSWIVVPGGSPLMIS